MKKKILVALDDSKNAMRAVKFIAQSFTPDHEVTLFSVVPDTASICDMNSPELTPYFISQQGVFCTMEDMKRGLVDKALQRGKEILKDAGFHEESIRMKIQKKTKSVAKDIIDEAQTGYTTVVMGRRGLSSIEEFFMGSVSQKVLHASKGISVLLVN